MPEPARVSVSEIRREIYRASGFASGEGQPSTDALGTLFHKIFQSLMQPNSSLNWTEVLDAENLADHDRLRQHVYANIIGPKLRENQAALQSSAREVLLLWEAAGQLCRYVCQLLANSVEHNQLRYDPRSHQWVGLEQFSVEEELTWLVEDSNWTAPVLVSGIADGVWRNPASKRWCVLELKLGAGSRDADLAQLCLYHEMLRAQSPGDQGQVALLHFHPELKHETLSEERIEPVKVKLRALIGRIAGVAGGAASSQPTLLHRELGARLVQVLEQFGPMVTLASDPVVGPSFLRFHITPKAGVKLSKILPLGEDVAVQLRLSKPALIRLEDSMLVVDLQRPDRETLWFKEFRGQLPKGEHGNARVLVGVDLKRRPRFADLHSDCPHLLAAGTSGSGKSEWLRMALASLLATNTPETLRLMLIDPKVVTFDDLRQSPYLLDDQALLHTPEEALAGLNRLIKLMDQRYLLFGEHHCADLAALQTKLIKDAPPRIVCFCDEYGNLVAGKKNRDLIEAAINQLGAKARAAGIHLILATQDPRAQILSPILKTNLSGRVCLRTTSSTQSRMMLEQNGAEFLLGHGDLLFKTTGEPVRLQAPLLEEDERLELFASQALRASN
jgi:DNA segregation ATPase FtsK/SpoIIIE, S-DNA-T family